MEVDLWQKKGGRKLRTPHEPPVEQGAFFCRLFDWGVVCLAAGELPQFYPPPAATQPCCIRIWP